MYQITEENRPKCINYKKCKNKAICFMNDMWVCGDCIIKLQNKLKEQKKDLILQE